MARYKFYPAGNMVICVSHYAKKKVVGKAKCAPGDTFDLEKGKQLAKLRCDLKIAEKRFKRAEQKSNETFYELCNLFMRNEKMIKYYEDATKALERARNDLAEYRASFEV